MGQFSANLAVLGPKKHYNQLKSETNSENNDDS